jgi:hypothetical protein
MRGSVTALTVILITLGCVHRPPESPSDTRRVLMDLERDSHQRWLERDLSALDGLMAPEFHFVVMNGTLEPKELILGSGPSSDSPGTRALQVSSLSIEPEEVLLRGGTAVVIGRMSIDATVAGRALPNQMRVLSVFVRDEPQERWQLMARSITPIMVPPAR